MNEVLKDVLDIIAIPITTLGLGLYLPQRWQKRQRDTQIKTELVTQIVELVMRTVMTIYMFKKHPTERNMTENIQESELEQVYKNWRVDTCVIGSKLHAYFPPKIHREWDDFSDMVTEYYENNWKNEGEKCVEESEGNINTLSKTKGDNKDNKCKLQDDKAILFYKKEKIIEKILDSDIRGFSRHKRRH